MTTTQHIVFFALLGLAFLAGYLCCKERNRDD
jgi:hypothetical protein